MIHQPKEFFLSGLNGISDETLDMHFKLYEGYVKNTNVLNEKISELLNDGKIDPQEMPAFSELKRRYGFEYNGMVLHEYLFGNMSPNGNSDAEKDSSFYKAAESSFGKYKTWKTDFISTGNMRGVGWVICYQDHEGRLSNHWITLHEEGNVAGFKPLLVMDVWEHAYLLDYKPAQRDRYIEAFFSNIDWNTVEDRMISSLDSQADIENQSRQDQEAEGSAYF